MNSCFCRPLQHTCKQIAQVTIEILSCHSPALSGSFSGSLLFSSQNSTLQLVHKPYWTHPLLSGTGSLRQIRIRQDAVLCTVRNQREGKSLVVQWLGLCAVTAEGLVSTSDQGTRISQDSWCSQTKRKRNQGGRTMYACKWIHVPGYLKKKLKQENGREAYRQQSYKHHDRAQYKHSSFYF